LACNGKTGDEPRALPSGEIKGIGQGGLADSFLKLTASKEKQVAGKQILRLGSIL